MNSIVLSCCFADVFKMRAPVSTTPGIFHPRIINGTVVSRQSIPVVEISIHASDGNYLCSGTMIAPDVVLTASHCVTKTASNHIVNLKGHRYGVSKVRVHPLAQTLSNGDIIYDLALLYLRRNPKSNYFPIITSRKAQAGDSIYIYGYGLDENQNTGQLKTGQMTVENVSSRWVFANYTGNGDSNTCEGDSGGPAFGVYLDKNNQQYLGLIAVTAGGTLYDCSVGDQSYFTNVQSSAAVSFMKKNVRSFARR